MMPGLRSIDLSLNRSLLAAREVKTPTGWIIPPDLNALVILQPRGFCSRRARHLRFVIWFVFSNLIHCGRLVLRMTNTHPRIALEFPMQRSRFGHDCDRNLVCLGALATLSSLEALRLCGCLEAWKLGDAQLGPLVNSPLLCPFWDTKIVSDYLECLNT